MSFGYHIFGLKVISDLPLPECVPIAQRELMPGSFDLKIRQGFVPLSLGTEYQVDKFHDFAASDFLMRIPKVGRIRATNGVDIHVDLTADARPEDVRAYLLGSAMGAILHQRREIPLHVSAVIAPTGVIAFTGASGAGKSTLATSLFEVSGWSILTDDLAILRKHEGSSQLVSGIRRIRLWDDTIEKLNLVDFPRTKVVARADKYQIDMQHAFCDSETKLGAVVLLSEGETTRLTRISGARGLVTLANSIYRPQYLEKFNDHKAVLERLSAVADEVDIYLLERPMKTDSIREAAQLVFDQFAIARS